MPNYWISPTKTEASYFSPTLRLLPAAWSYKQWSHFSSQNLWKVFLTCHLLFLPGSLELKSPLGYFMPLTPLKLTLSRSLMPSTSPRHSEWVPTVFDLSKTLDRPEGVAQLVEYLPKMKTTLDPVLKCGSGHLQSQHTGGQMIRSSKSMIT